MFRQDSCQAACNKLGLCFLAESLMFPEQPDDTAGGFEGISLLFLPKDCCFVDLHSFQNTLRHMPNNLAKAHAE